MGKRKKPEVKKALIYGSLYMDQGESLELAEKQIDECIAKASAPLEKLSLAFDIVATPAQITSGLARQWGQHVLDYCDQHYAQLFTRVVGITDDDQRRPMRDTLISRKLTEKDIDDVHLIEME